MTVEQVAQNLGVSAETLMQEVIIKQTAWHMFFTVVVVLVFLAVTVCFIWMAIQDIAFVGALLPIVVIAAAMLIAEAHDLAAWETAPETTANQYIVEHYGGIEK